jgi:RimJ/RimL family protein N-acetyltransferase
MTGMPTLETPRLLIRPFDLADLDHIHSILIEAFPSDPPIALEARRQWLAWTIMGYEQLALLHQPPYGDRAIVLKTTGELIGACGYAPCLCPFGQLPGFPEVASPARSSLHTSEIGLFYAMSSLRRKQGYTSEAAAALVTYGFEHLQAARIVATTTYDNEGSMAVMRHIGMTILRNPLLDPFWFQVVGVIEYGASRGAM